ncbi:hypothetical protein JOF56_010925 [Kibdelosporangium banguiense]|uniref:Coronafacic acid synthetase n=1 Tax=Kibdelosporangium banguiense TaxID=1365924 RepID=A0ABS4U1K8_9PSEU|nr:hypothetical protein [Kibdelosporangium banguiense]MBP2330540.1 hypothetical protein [Kibdelosporangium banguiense]
MPALDELAAVPDDLVVLGHGGTDRAEPDGRRRIPSMYVDPVSWLVLEAVDEALADCPDTVRQSPDEVAVMLVSTHATLHTMTEIAKAIPSGRLSPLRFAGASPGGAASLTCLVHKFRGPSLMMTTTPDEGWPAALTMARFWLRTGAATSVVLSAHTASDHGHRVRTVVLGANR